jgi:hypothetical protein
VAKRRGRPQRPGLAALASGVPCLAGLHTLGSGVTDPKLVGLQTLPRGSAHPGSRAVDPLALGLQPSEWVCAQGWADLAPSVYMLGPRLAPAPCDSSLGERAGARGLLNAQA